VAPITFSAVPPRRSRGAKEVLLGYEHYVSKAGTFNSLSGDRALGYLLLSSYEPALRSMESTQQMLLAASSLGILLASTIIWFLIRKASQPLRALRDSAEAVGRGDFSRRVQATTNDECGELATV